VNQVSVPLSAGDPAFVFGVSKRGVSPSFLIPLSSQENYPLFVVDLAGEGSGLRSAYILLINITKQFNIKRKTNNRKMKLILHKMKNEY
jgi:hypothetical protein